METEGAGEPGKSEPQESKDKQDNASAPPLEQDKQAR